MSRILAMYDVIGIQEFIFASKKLQENLGASIIVQQLFENALVKTIKETTQRYRIDWKERDMVFELLDQSTLQAEVIYIGGGNALVAYQDSSDAQNIAKKVTQALSLYVAKHTNGTLRFAVAYTPMTDNFHKDQELLWQELKRNKYQTFHSVPLLGIGITRAGQTDELPAVGFLVTDTEKDKGEYLSRSALWKRWHTPNKLSKAWKTAWGWSEKPSLFTNPFDELCPSGCAFPLDFNRLGQKEGADDIAVVHIDGNNMGKTLNTVLKGIADYRTAVKTLRQFSRDVANTYHDVMKQVIGQVASAMLVKPFEKNAFRQNFDLDHQSGYTSLPICPIVLNGDDVTFVCEGRIGIPLAELFLTQLADLPALPQGGKLSACTGVAIVNSHFPFYRAYQLAEELCKSAKLKAKILAEQQETDQIGNWLDFHIVQSGVTTDLQELRERLYNVPGMSPPTELKATKPGDVVVMRYAQYNALWRPWCIAGPCDPQYQWTHLNSLMTEFARKRNENDVLWGRSRLKRLEHALTTSKEESETLIAEYRSRDLKLPSFDEAEAGQDQKKISIWKGTTEQTPYFDALELLEYYLPIPPMKGATPCN